MILYEVYPHPNVMEIIFVFKTHFDKPASFLIEK